MPWPARGVQRPKSPHVDVGNTTTNDIGRRSSAGGGGRGSTGTNGSWATDESSGGPGGGGSSAAAGGGGSGSTAGLVAGAVARFSRGSSSSGGGGPGASSGASPPVGSIPGGRRGVVQPLSLPAMPPTPVSPASSAGVAGMSPLPPRGGGSGGGGAGGGGTPRSVPTREAPTRGPPVREAPIRETPHREAHVREDERTSEGGRPHTPGAGATSGVPALTTGGEGGGWGGGPVPSGPPVGAVAPTGGLAAAMAPSESLLRQPSVFTQMKKEEVLARSAMPASEMFPVEEAQVGPRHFTRLRLLGRGGIGRVYLVLLKGTTKLYAMKVLTKEEMISRNKVKRVLTEREILATANHPFSHHDV
eukprot:TRINITY_DN2439_c0_g1_i1.p1 TRINITY_DN2439_c0_g1~~TRINITY_DN2439_c0_g1_i1.p1  ORF type:complete len:360 (-),score=74.29 TRINITY_DN2439_c0_g1_i1:89-1168(-)